MAKSDAETRLRQQALTWMETNRKLLVSRLASTKADDMKYVADRLSAWLKEPDLTATQDEDGREGWSEEETAAWDRFWADVREITLSAAILDKRVRVSS